MFHKTGFSFHHMVSIVRMELAGEEVCIAMIQRGTLVGELLLLLFDRAST